jgi:hypothetical protein
MRMYDNGAFFTVTVSEAEVDGFNRRWPCSTLEGRQMFQFQQSNGDLVDRTGRGDGSEAVALSQDAYAYGARKLGLERGER